MKVQLSIGLHGLQSQMREAIQTSQQHFCGPVALKTQRDFTTVQLSDLYKGFLNNHE